MNTICVNFTKKLLILASFRSVFKFFLDPQIIFLKKSVISNFFCPKFILCFIKLFTKNSSILKIYSEISQNLFKILSNLE